MPTYSPLEVGCGFEVQRKFFSVNEESSRWHSLLYEAEQLKNLTAVGQSRDAGFVGFQRKARNEHIATCSRLVPHRRFPPRLNMSL